MRSNVVSTLAIPRMTGTLPPRNSGLVREFLILAVLLASFVSREEVFISLAVVFVLIEIFFRRNNLKNITRTEYGILSTYVGVLVLILPVSASRAPTALWHFVVAVSGMLYSLVVIRNPQIYLKAVRYTLIVYQVVLLGVISQNGFFNHPFEDLVGEGSANGITSYLIAVQSAYFVAKISVSGTPSIFTNVASVYLCLAGYNRGSIVASFALFLLSVISIVQRSIGGRRYLVVLILFIVAGIIGVGGFVDDAGVFLSSNTKLSQGLYDDSRAEINRQYLQSLNFGRFIAGSDYKDTIIETHFFRNPHNSFIRAHYIFGILYLMVVLAIPIIVAFKSGLPIGVVILGVIGIFVMLFRASTEPIIFPTVLDVFYYGSCFILLHSRGRNNW